MIQKGEYVIVDSRIAWHEFYPTGKCHDCRKPSNEYRCERCKQIFEAKHYTYKGTHMVEGGLPSIDEIFKGIRCDMMFADN